MVHTSPTLLNPLCCLALFPPPSPLSFTFCHFLSVCGLVTTPTIHVLASHYETNLVCASFQSGESNSASALALDYKQKVKSGVRWIHVSGFEFWSYAEGTNSLWWMDGWTCRSQISTVNYFVPVKYVSYVYEKEDSVTLLLYKTRWDSLSLLSWVMSNNYRHLKHSRSSSRTRGVKGQSSWRPSVLLALPHSLSHSTSLWMIL